MVKAPVTNRHDCVAMLNTSEPIVGTTSVEIKSFHTRSTALLRQLFPNAFPEVITDIVLSTECQNIILLIMMGTIPLLELRKCCQI